MLNILKQTTKGKVNYIIQEYTKEFMLRLISVQGSLVKIFPLISFHTFVFRRSAKQLQAGWNQIQQWIVEHKWKIIAPMQCQNAMCSVNDKPKARFNIVFRKLDWFERRASEKKSTQIGNDN
jgi:hypothetical protein